jgi:hypothetical protein
MSTGMKQQEWCAGPRADSVIPADKQLNGGRTSVPSLDYKILLVVQGQIRLPSPAGFQHLTFESGRGWHFLPPVFLHLPPVAAPNHLGTLSCIHKRAIFRVEEC